MIDVHHGGYDYDDDHHHHYTMPMMANIDARHNEITNKYAHFLTDISEYKCTLNCFEVTSTGFVRSRNQKTLHKLHSLMRKDHEKISVHEQLGLVWLLPDLAVEGGPHLHLPLLPTSPPNLIFPTSDSPLNPPISTSNLWTPPASLPSLPEQAPIHSYLDLIY